MPPHPHHLCAPRREVGSESSPAAEPSRPDTASGFHSVSGREFEPFRLLDLFSGVGGFSLGLERTGGFKTVAFCEIDPFCRRVLAKHWPEVPCYDDIRELTAERLTADGIAVDAICGGFPCQDISSAGKQAGLAGVRSRLWRAMARLIGEIRPSYVILENSSELLRLGAGEVFADLAALGFHIQWDCIPACAVGAPHGRDRIWIVAHAPQEQGVHQPNIGYEFRRWLSDNRDAWVSCPWETSSAAVCGVDDGIPDRVDRTGALGNAVVPQIPELIGNAILAAHRARTVEAA
jgi:DNA (cytosine-5)-methyltransferase 1